MQTINIIKLQYGNVLDVKTYMVPEGTDYDKTVQSAEIQFIIDCIAIGLDFELKNDSDFPLGFSLSEVNLVKDWGWLELEPTIQMLLEIGSYKNKINSIQLHWSKIYKHELN